MVRSHVGEPDSSRCGAVGSARDLGSRGSSAGGGADDGSRPATETRFKRVLGCGRSSTEEPWAVNPLVPVRLRPVTPKRMPHPCVANSSGRVPDS